MKVIIEGYNFIYAYAVALVVAGPKGFWNTYAVALSKIVAVGGGFNSKFDGFSVVFGTSSCSNVP